MKATVCFTFLWLSFCCGTLQAQRFATNNVSRAQAIKVASQLWTNMPEESVAFIVEKKHGLVQGSCIGAGGEWVRFYVLRDGSSLDLRFELERILPDGRGNDGLLRSASISVNGMKEVPITLTNAPQPGGAASRSRSGGSETNRTSSAAGSGG
jgi:hypothetical protein